MTATRTARNTGAVAATVLDQPTSGATGTGQGHPIPADWSFPESTWAIYGITLAQVQPYLVPGIVEHMNVSSIVDYALHGVPAEDVVAYRAGGVRHPARIGSLWGLGCRPAVATAWLAARTNPLNLSLNVTRLLGAYRDARQATARIDLIDAFLLGLPLDPNGQFNRPAFIRALDIWTSREAQPLLANLPPARILLLHRGGFTPTDVLADPLLGTCPTDALTTLIALRAPTGDQR